MCGSFGGETTTCAEGTEGCEDFGTVCDGLDILIDCGFKTMTCAFGDLGCECPIQALCPNGDIVECDASVGTVEDCATTMCPIVEEQEYVQCGFYEGETVQCLTGTPDCNSFGNACIGETISRECSGQTIECLFD